MGISVTYYFGPYVETKSKLVDITVDRCKKISSCPDQEEGFCVECGIRMCSRYEKVKDVEEADKDEHEIFENGEMFNTSCMGPNATDVEVENGIRFRRIWWYPGRVKGGEAVRPYSFNNDKNDEAHEFSVNSDKELKWFKKAYAKEIAKLKKVYGNAEVKWGFLKWCS